MAASSHEHSTDSGSEGDFLAHLFSRLKQNGIHYAVMRNYELLPASAGGSDLDILVYPQQLDAAIVSVRNAVQDAGGAIIGIAHASGIVKIQALGRTGESSEKWWGLSVDLFPGFRFAGIDILDSRIEVPVRHYQGIRVLPTGFSGVLGVLKEALNNRRFPKRYADDARQGALEDWTEIAHLLSPIGRDALTRLERMLTSDIAVDLLDSECQKLRWEVLMHAFVRRPHTSIRDAFNYQWSKVQRYCKPSGVTVAILGVDGAGKSTVIAAIRPALEAATHHALQVRHLRPNLLPPLGRLKGQSRASVGPVLEPHSKPTSGMFVSFLRLAYLTLDYQLGYWLWTRFQIAKLPNIVLFDRYSYDMALDPRRFRVGLSPQIAGWFARLAPTPDLIFCLHGDPTVIAARKGELSVEETARQIRALRDFAEGNSRAALVATDKSVKETRDEVLGRLLEFLENRQMA